MSKRIICDYCGEDAELVKGKVIYPHRKDLYDRYYYLCRPCGAWVGTHIKSRHPMGRLANKELRRAKQRAHEAFDPLWKSGVMFRKEAYRWLSRQLGIPCKSAHIGKFDVDMCNRVVDTINNTSHNERVFK